MKIGIKASVPTGAYNTTFAGVEKTDHPEYGAGLCWAWEITDNGRFRSQRVMRTTKDIATAKNSCGKFLMALTAKTLEQAQNEDLDAYIGTPCSVIIELSPESGGTRVGSFAVIRSGESDVPF